jgi:tetratricopeptide (TPR) repeat protein
MPAAGLPVPSAGLPLRAGELPLPLVGPSSSPPAQPSFSEIDLDMTATAPSVPPRSGGFGEIELPPAAASYRPAPAFDAGLEGDPFGDAPIPSQPPATAPVPLPSPAPSPPPSAESVVRSGGGSTSYGEVNLEGGASDVAVEAAARSGPPPGEDGIEFGAIPEEGPRAARVPDAARMPSHGAKRRQRWPLRTFAALLVVAVGGGSLSLVESVGPYGVYWIGDRLHAGEHERLLADSISRTQRALARDTWPEASRAFEELGAARGRAKRFRPFAAYVAFDGYLSELRFGSVPEIRARAKVLLDEVGPESPAYADLARAARLALDGELANAESAAARLVASRGRDVDAAVLAAEIALRSKRGSASVQAWQKVRALEPSARAAFGMARARYAAGDAAGAEAEAKQALLRSPEHVGARILLARIASGKPGKEAETVRELDSLLKDPRAASPDEVAAAETLLGDVQLGRSHVSLAMAAYGRALKVRPGSAPALSGMGEALFQAGRYAEALPRFEGSVQAEPGSVAAEVGVAKSKLMLERIEDAARALAKLAAAEPKRPLVALWYGRALEAANDRDRASAIYHAAIDAGSKSPEIVDVYIALATLQNQRGQADEAQKTLATARDRLPDSALVYRALGELALAQARPSDAIRELEKALRIDPEDLAATFQLGVAQRRSQNFEAATQHFDKVAAVDHDYPGLALERGMIFEATGKGAEALKAYRDALAKAPKDPDLMLRVGCGGVAAGELEAAEDLLHKVLVQRPNSAEASHCLGRALLARNKLPDAQRLLDRAVDLDPTRAVFHLYSGWAANEGGNVAKADRELQAALALDNTLADAYWQRGVLRQRQGAVKDAVADLIQALKLNPARNDAHAALADAYYDLGREHDALAEWQKAVQAQPDNAAWRFRYGKLLVTNQMNDAGRVELERAVQWGEKSESPPRWLWEAHHFLARALGSRAEAAQHWEQFLRLGPRDSPYRKEAKQALERLGRPWSGN